jgi:hypothetical protein
VAGPAIAAARAVGPTGRVFGLDVAAPTPDALTALLASGGAADPVAEAVPARHDLDRPDRFWEVVLGTARRPG